MWVTSLGQEDSLKKKMATLYSCLETPTDRKRTERGVWWATVHGVVEKSDIDLGTKQQLLLEYCKCVCIKGVPTPLEYQRNLILGVSNGTDSDRVLACDFPRPCHFRQGSSSQSVDWKNNSQLRYLIYPCSFVYLKALKVNRYREVEMDNIYINHAL